MCKMLKFYCLLMKLLPKPKDLQPSLYKDRGFISHQITKKLLAEHFQKFTK